tara:strand:- start:292 stop:546 length:255 start_codon:yes stop_codon:yes gene_type:complete
MKAYNQKISKLRQTDKQRESSMIAEAKWGNRNPLEFTNDRVLLKKSAFAQNILMNRYLMKNASLNNANNIHDYTSTMYEVKRAA